VKGEGPRTHGRHEPERTTTEDVIEKGREKGAAMLLKLLPGKRREKTRGKRPPRLAKP